MGQRLELHEILADLLGSRHVYYQPPANVQMQYPCIVYGQENADTEFAGNKPYAFTKRYQVTVIARDPDSDIPDRVAKLPMTSYSRIYVANQLHHDVFTLYF